jgi:hypothetical protein
MEKEVVCLDAGHAGLIIISRRFPVARSLRDLVMTLLPRHVIIVVTTTTTQPSPSWYCHSQYDQIDVDL